MSVAKLMTLIDDNKDKMPENDYLELCNLMKELHKQKEESFDYVKIVYRTDLTELVMEDKGTLPFEGFIFKYDENDQQDTDYTFEILQDVIMREVFDKLSFECYQKIIKKFGGRKEGLKKMKIYIGEDYKEYMKNRFNKICRHMQNRIMAYHIIDHLLFEYEFVGPYQDALRARDVVRIWQELD